MNDGIEIWMPVAANEEVLDGKFNFQGRMVYSSLDVAIKNHANKNIMHGLLNNPKEISECVCQLMVGNTWSQFSVKWIGTYSGT